MKRVIFFLCGSMLFGCASSPDQPSPIRGVVSGFWQLEGESCSTAVKYSFSEDGAIMYAESDSGLFISEGGEAHDRLRYKVLFSSDTFLRTIIEGEERRDVNGNVVIWDLVLINESRFCWHRGDWEKNSCTRPLVKCDSNS